MWVLLRRAAGQGGNEIHNVTWLQGAIGRTDFVVADEDDLIQRDGGKRQCRKNIGDTGAFRYLGSDLTLKTGRRLNLKGGMQTNEDLHGFTSYAPDPDPQPARRKRLRWG